MQDNKSRFKTDKYIISLVLAALWDKTTGQTSEASASEDIDEEETTERSEGASVSSEKEEALRQEERIKVNTYEPLFDLDGFTGGYQLAVSNTDVDGLYNFAVFRPNFNSVLNYLHPCVDENTGIVKYANVNFFDHGDNPNLLGYHVKVSNEIGLQRQPGDLTGSSTMAVYVHEQSHWDNPYFDESQNRKHTYT